MMFAIVFGNNSIIYQPHLKSGGGGGGGGGGGEGEEKEEEEEEEEEREINFSILKKTAQGQ